MSIKQSKNDSIALRKQLIQMRMELNRQKICHESLVLLEPVQKLRDYKQRLSQGSTPVLIVAGVTLASFFITRNRHSASSLLPLVKIAASLLPIFIATPTVEADKTAPQADNLK